MSKVRVVFQTTPVAVPPDQDGPFAGCPQTKSMTYVRYFDLDMEKLWISPPNDKVTLYGEKYKISSIGLSHKSIGVILSEEQMSQFLAKAKAHGHRWKKEVENKIDGRKLFRAAAYRMSLN